MYYVCLTFLIRKTNRKKCIRCYPFGELLPSRNSLNYRYVFQGQELDTETGMEAFQLRLWDGRLGRWLSPDPYRQYASPYLGMGNNPISSIDPDGGFDTEPTTPGITHSAQPEGDYYWNSNTNLYEFEPKNVGFSQNTIYCMPMSVNHNDAFGVFSNTFYDPFPNTKWEWFENRKSGWIFIDGEMKSDFVGGTLGKDGELYRFMETPIGPTGDVHDVKFSRTLKDLKLGSDIINNRLELASIWITYKETISNKNAQPALSLNTKMMNDTIYFSVSRNGNDFTTGAYMIQKSRHMIAIHKKDTLDLGKY